MLGRLAHPATSQPVAAIAYIVPAAAARAEAKEARTANLAWMAIPVAAASSARAPEMMEEVEMPDYTGSANRRIGARHAHFAEDCASPPAYSNMY